MNINVSMIITYAIGPDYNRFKNKAPSTAPLFDLMGMDIFRMTSKVDQIAAHLTFPESWHVPFTKSSCIPLFLVVNVQLPEELGTSLLSLFENITDGPGFSLVYYYRLSSLSRYLTQTMRILPRN